MRDPVVSRTYGVNSVYSPNCGSSATLPIRASGPGCGIRFGCYNPPPPTYCVPCKPAPPKLCRPCKPAPKKQSFFSKIGSFFGKVFDKVGSVFSGIGKVLGGVVKSLSPLISLAAPLLGPVGLAISGAVSIGGSLAASMFEKVGGAMSGLKSFFKA